MYVLGELDFFYFFLPISLECLFYLCDFTPCAGSICWRSLQWCGLGLVHNLGCREGTLLTGWDHGGFLSRHAMCCCWRTSRRDYGWRTERSGREDLRGSLDRGTDLQSRRFGEGSWVREVMNQWLKLSLVKVLLINYKIKLLLIFGIFFFFFWFYHRFIVEFNGGKF